MSIATSVFIFLENSMTAIFRGLFEHRGNPVNYKLFVRKLVQLKNELVL